MQIQELIDTAKFLLASYMDYTNPSPTRTVQTYGIYDPVIAVVSTYFEVNKYYLADELLVHAASNTRLDSQYIPINIDRITSSRVWQEIRKDKGRSGIGEFANTGTTVQKDLYYAIHLFEWSREKKGNYEFLVFSDRYDFAPGDYSSIPNVAVNAMYQAQQAGDLTPFYTFYQE